MYEIQFLLTIMIVRIDIEYWKESVFLVFYIVIFFTLL